MTVGIYEFHSISTIYIHAVSASDAKNYAAAWFPDAGYLRPIDHARATNPNAIGATTSAARAAIREYNEAQGIY